MENRAYALITGVFVIAIAAGIVLWANWLAGSPVQRLQYRVVSLRPITGLNEQAQVRYRGIDAGRVTSIRLDRDNPNRILIAIEVDQDVPITRGTYAQLGMEGITGIAYVHLLDDYTLREPPPKGRDGVPEIHLRPSFLDMLTDNAEAVLRDGRVLISEITKLVNEENRERIGRALARLEDLIVELDKTAKLLPGAIERTDERLQAWLNEKNRRNVESMLANLNQASRGLPALVEESQQLVRDARALASRASELATEATALARESQGTVRDVRSTTLPKVNALADSVERSARRVGELADELERRPDSLLWGRGAERPGPGEEGFQ
ncbi:MAG TPA: MlaD family protein [Burkholderiales bacterium]|nr:MlaD family protein [Burkholderiales bacterium]